MAEVADSATNRVKLSSRSLIPRRSTTSPYAAAASGEAIAATVGSPDSATACIAPAVSKYVVGAAFGRDRRNCEHCSSPWGCDRIREREDSGTSAVAARQWSTFQVSSPTMNSSCERSTA